ncbi:MAG: V-type ATP synthase subunit A [Candidatus Hermodarchaeota archaeon]
MSADALGRVIRIAGSVVEIEGLSNVQLYEIVRIGEEKLVGEVIRIQKRNGSHVSIAQVYEETQGLAPEDPAWATGNLLSVELGPGLINQIFDGIQRPLPIIRDKTGSWISRGIEASALDKEKEWEFKPLLKAGDHIKPGMIIGEVPETVLIDHKILVPPNFPEGKLKEIAEPGTYPLKTPIGVLETKSEEIPLKMFHSWPVRVQRPIKGKLPATIPLRTGQRILDTFFPIAKGGTAGIPGGFGTGKCVTGDTPILLTNGTTVPIWQIYRSSIRSGTLEKDTEDETISRLNKPLEVFSFDGEKYVPCKATHVYRGKTNAIIEITTRNGRKVKVTPIHKLLRFNGEIIEEKEAQHLQENDYLVVPRQICKPDNGITTFNPYDIDLSLRAIDPQVLDDVTRLMDEVMKEKNLDMKTLGERCDVSYFVAYGYYKQKNKPTLNFIKKLTSLAGVDLLPVELVKSERQSAPFYIPKQVTPEFAEWLGLFVADGHIKGTKGGIYLYNSSEKILNRWKELTKIVFKADTEYGHDSDDSTPYERIRNATLQRFLYHIGIPKTDKTYNVRIPSCISSGSTELLIHFLAGYTAGDGSFSGYTLEFGTSSKALFSDLAYLLSRLQILYRGSNKETEKAIHYRINIEGEKAVQLAEKFKTFEVYPYEKFQSLFAYASESIEHFRGLDVVPIGQKLLADLESQGKNASGHDIFRKTANIRLRNYIELNQTPSLHMVQKIANVIEIEENQVEPDTKNKLNHIINLSKHVYFDRIKEIKIHEEEATVYDITVEKFHNFIGGTLPFTLHNTVTQHQLARWSDAKVVVYVGCGERGNEMTEVLESFPKLTDPYTGEPLMSRTVLIANTSNMPVAAREASIYTGITLAEYYRDQGFDVALMADSTSRWAEALREISSRLEEMPGEQSFPAYLASRIGEFYERAGRVRTLNEADASISVIGAVSPGGGDFSEPVTQNTLRTVRVFWALDTKLAFARHFPAISWLESYSLYNDTLREWYDKNVSPEFSEIVARAMTLLQKEKELQEIVQLVGPDALPEREKIILESARMIREDFLQQSAYSDDSYCSLEKQYQILSAIMRTAQKLEFLIDAGYTSEELQELPVIEQISRLKWYFDTKEKKEFTEKLNEVNEFIDSEITSK